MLEKNPDSFISLRPDSPQQLLLWTATIKAPPYSVYEGFEFEVSIECKSDYPLTPPKMTFITKIFHPNVLFDVRISIQ